MKLNVVERARAIATFRFVEVRLMEIVAAWTPTTPEMEAKVMFGRHIWDFAQHADALGKRTFELRHPEHYSRRPVDGYVALLDETAVLTATGDRLTALYDVLVHGLAARYGGYREDADEILDGPTLVIVDRILADLARQRADAERLRGELGLPARATGALGVREAAIVELVTTEVAA
jgi:hypothetical protein